MNHASPEETAKFIHYAWIVLYACMGFLIAGMLLWELVMVFIDKALGPIQTPDEGYKKMAELIEKEIRS